MRREWLTPCSRLSLQTPCPELVEGRGRNEPMVRQAYHEGLYVWQSRTLQQTDSFWIAASTSCALTPRRLCCFVMTSDNCHLSIFKNAMMMEGCMMTKKNYYYMEGCYEVVAGSAMQRRRHIPTILIFTSVCYTCIANIRRNIMLALRLPEDIEKRLAALAKKTGRTKSFYAREAIIEKLEDLEDYYLAKERLENDSGERISLEEVMVEFADDLEKND